MQVYTKTYMTFFNFDTSDYIPCELQLEGFGCQHQACDIHHIHGRGPDLTNNITNLIALCRPCHDLAHSSAVYTEKVQKIHNAYIKNHQRTY